MNGQRFIAYPQVSWPLRSAWGYVTPKAGFHFTRYNVAGATTRASRTPRARCRSRAWTRACIFDRPWDFGAGRFQQTLEPRLFYVRVPYRDQSHLPNFSTAEVDFGANSLFRDNRFIGGDRIGDANQVTAAVTSRLVESDTGLERLKATLGQIYYFEPQRVTLSGPPREDKKSDLVALLSGQVTPAFSIDGGLEYNASSQRAQRIDVSARYSPRPGSLVNAAYRFTRDQVKQVDLSAQWPVTAAMSAVGRWNWSLQDRKLIEGLAGFEYNAGCWEIARGRAPLHHRDAAGIDLLPDPARALRALEDRHQSARDPEAEHFRLPPVRRDSLMTTIRLLLQTAALLATLAAAAALAQQPAAAPARHPALGRRRRTSSPSTASWRS